MTWCDNLRFDDNVMNELSVIYIFRLLVFLLSVLVKFIDN